MNTIRLAALGLALVIASAPVFAMDGNSEQPHTMPVAVAYAGGYAAPDLGSEQDPGFALGVARTLSSADGVVVGRSEDGAVRFADTGSDLNG